MTYSAFGVDHGYSEGATIAKYSMAYGNNRKAIAEIQREKLKKMAAIKAKKSPGPKSHDHVNEWFGQAAPHKPTVAKSFSANAARLTAAAAKGDKYAQMRLAAGSQGKHVAMHTQMARQANSTKGIGRIRARGAAKTHTVAANQAKALGNTGAREAKTIASTRSAANFAKPRTASGVRPTEARQGMSFGNKLMLGSIGAGAAGGSAGALYQNRKQRTA